MTKAIVRIDEMCEGWISKARFDDIFRPSDAVATLGSIRSGSAVKRKALIDRAFPDKSKGFRKDMVDWGGIVLYKPNGRLQLEDLEVLQKYYYEAGLKCFCGVTPDLKACVIMHK